MAALSHSSPRAQHMSIFAEQSSIKALLQEYMKVRGPRLVINVSRARDVRQTHDPKELPRSASC